MSAGTDQRIAIDAYMDAGLLPADDAPRQWIADRWEAYLELANANLILARQNDVELLLQLTTASGVIRSEVRCDDTDLGHAVFVAAVEALVSAAGGVR